LLPDAGDLPLKDALEEADPCIESGLAIMEGLWDIKGRGAMDIPDIMGGLGIMETVPMEAVPMEAVAMDALPMAKGLPLELLIPMGLSVIDTKALGEDSGTLT